MEIVFFALCIAVFGVAILTAEQDGKRGIAIIQKENFGGWRCPDVSIRDSLGTQGRTNNANRKKFYGFNSAGRCVCTTRSVVLY